MLRSSEFPIVGVESFTHWLAVSNAMRVGCVSEPSREKAWPRCSGCVGNDCMNAHLSVLTWCNLFCKNIFFWSLHILPTIVQSSQPVQLSWHGASSIVHMIYDAIYIFKKTFIPHSNFGNKQGLILFIPLEEFLGSGFNFRQQLHIVARGEESSQYTAHLTSGVFVEWVFAHF